MKMISGFLEPNQGEVEVDGTNLAHDPNQIQLGLGYLPESLPVYPEMIVADYLDYVADLKGLTGDTKKSEIKRVIKATDISAKILAPIATLSRGYKQRVGVAQAILGKPKLLILDEPTNGLDPEQTQHMRNLIREIAQDATVILSTHIMQEVDALCTRVLMLNAGKLTVDAQLEELRQCNQLLIETSLPKNDSLKLRESNGIESISIMDTGLNKGPSLKYRILLEADANIKEVSSALASTIIEQGYKLYTLQPELRDLETLFHEVSEQQYQQEEVSDAV
jgi:ABC-2 type transport system ATP-binding protein